MAPTVQSAGKRRRIWPWILALCLAPYLVLGMMAASILTLDGDATALRHRVMAASNSDWHTTVQLSLGRLSLAAARTGLAFVPRMDARATLALQAVHSASVGVYERKGREGIRPRSQLFADADRAMGRRGFSRLVGVCDQNDTVLIYAPADVTGDTTINVCLAVVSDRELVVVSTEVDAAVLAQLAAAHSFDDVKQGLHLAGL